MYQNLLVIYPGIFKTDRIGQNFIKLLKTGLLILGLPSSIPSPEPLGQILWYSSLSLFTYFVVIQ